MTAPHDAGTVAQSLGLVPGLGWHLVSLTVDGGGKTGSVTALALHGDEDGDDGLWAVLVGGVWANPHDLFALHIIKGWNEEARQQIAAHLADYRDELAMCIGEAA